MWVLKFKVVDKNCIWATRCKKFKIYDYQYPLSFYYEGSDLALVMYHIIEGEEKAKKKFIREVKKDKRVKHLKMKKDFIVSLVIEKRPKKELSAFAALYNPKLIHIRPGINYPDGSEMWELGSFERQDLVKLIGLVRKHYQGKLLSLKQINVPKIFMPEIMPELTEKQYQAFKSASQQGYYVFPRETNLHKLAKISKISRPTFEEHLRKAENKLLKFMKELILH